MGRMTVERFTDELFADVAQGSRARSVGVIGLIASSGTMSNIGKVLALVGRGTKLILGPRYAAQCGGAGDVIKYNRNKVRSNL